MSYRPLVHYLIVLSLGLSPIMAHASGFRIPLENVGDLGNAYAGGAALTQDASINAYNAAGLSFVHKQQFVAGAIGVLSHTTFRGTATADALIDFVGDPFSATGKERSNSNGIIPSFYYSNPINERIDVGIGVNTPFGLGLDFGEDSMLRYGLVNAEQISFNIGPSISYLITPQWSIGAGPNFQYYSLTASVMQNTTSTFLGTTDSKSKVQGNHWGYGGHIGILFAPNEASHFGLSYRSKISHHIEGESQFRSGVSPLLSSTDKDFALKFNTPANLMFSANYAFSPDWSLMGTVDYTYWSTFKNIKLYNVAAVDPVTNLPTSISSILPENFKNAWHMAIAANHQWNEHWLMRFGIGYDQKPTRTSTRTLEFPNGNTVAVAIGARYHYTPQMAFDMGYMHSFIQRTDINHTSAITGASEVGTLQTTGDTFGLGLVWTLC